MILLGLLALGGIARADEPAPPAQPPPDDEIIRGQRGWITDASVGAPVLKYGEAKFVASGAIGYRWTKLELILSGSVNRYASASNDVFSATTRSGAWLNGAYVAGKPGDRFRWLFLVEQSLTSYLTRYNNLPGIPAFDPKNPDLTPYLEFDITIENETSLMLRNTGFVGFLLAPSPLTQARVVLGLGFQAEFYVKTSFDEGKKFGIESQTGLSARGLVRGAVRHRLAPDLVAVRFSSDSSRFEISRTSAAIQLSRSPTGSFDLFRLTQIESYNRLAVDIEKLAFVGLMPSVFGGVDLSFLRSDEGSALALVPVFGVGLTNGRL